MNNLTPQEKIRKSRLGRRRQPHLFVPSSGHPTLCCVCNAGKDDTERGKYIHTI